MHSIGVSSVEQGARASCTLNVGTWMDLPIGEWGGRELIHHACDWSADGFTAESRVDDSGYSHARVPTRVDVVDVMVHGASHWTQFTVDVRGMHPPTRVAGVQSRLHRLGFFNGYVNGEQDALYVEALRAFQEQRGIVVTGQLGIETVRALASVPGSALLLGRTSRTKRRPR